MHEWRDAYHAGTDGDHCSTQLCAYLLKSVTQIVASRLRIEGIERRPRFAQTALPIGHHLGRNRKSTSRSHDHVS